MTILVDPKTKVLVQGITGREGSARTKFMKEYGTNVVAGVTPGRGGQEVHGIPVYNTIEEAVRKQGPIETSVTFIPGAFVKDAALEAIDAGIKLVVMPVERVPLHDILEIVAYAKRHRARILGPGSIGIISPGKVVVGWLGGTAERARKVFVPGPVCVLSRSGGQSATVPWALLQEGMGTSTVLHIGTEPVVGTSFAEVLTMAEEDEETQAVAVFGEIGGTYEEEMAEVVRKELFTKPLVVYVAGAWAPEGMRFSHASSIVERGRGSAKSKIEALVKVGAYVVDTPEKIAPTAKRVLKGRL